MGMEEQILAAECSKGDRMAQQELYDRYAGRLLGICKRYAGVDGMAEDLLHDAFLRIYGAFDKFHYRGAGSLRAWMERVTVNLALEYLRRQKHFVGVSLDQGKPIPELIEPTVDEVRHVPQQVLMRLVEELPEGYRTVFNLFCIEGHSHREIAEMLGINEKSSSSQLFRAKALLATKIKSYLKATDGYERG